MKYNNTLKDDTNELKEALVNWVFGLDGYNGAIGGVFEAIPWGEEVQSICPWEDWQDKFDNAIGSRCPWDDKCAEIILNSEKRDEFIEFINYKIDKIVAVYDKLVLELNNKTQKCAVVRVIESIENSDCVYDPTDWFYGDSYYDVINKVWKYYGFESGYTYGKFVDAMYNGVVSINSKIQNKRFYTELIKK